MTKSITLDDFKGNFIATQHEAQQDDVDFVLSQKIDEQGRSEWFFLRLANGDLCLATYPQDEIYLTVSEKYA